MPRLTLCLIAKNEEEMLPGCLASVRGVVDEIVLVDTGSTDRTREIAFGSGAKVFDRSWDDDFAAPRNLAARQATGDWLLVLDADERLARGSARSLRAAMKLKTFDVGMLRLHNARDPAADFADVLSGKERVGPVLYLPRLVRNVDAPVWRGAIHENVGEWLVRRGGKRRNLEVDLVHLGYIAEVSIARNKRERNLALLKRSCEKEAKDVTPRGYLALELLELGRHEEAWRVVEEGWRLVPEQPKHRDLARITVARSLLALRKADPAAVLETVLQGEARNGPHPDFDFLRGIASEILALRAAPNSAERIEAFRVAEASYRSALAKLEASKAWDFLGAVTLARGGVHLGVVLLLTGRAGEALARFASVLEEEPGCVAARVGAAEALIDVGEATKALETLEKALDGRPDGWLVAASAAHALGAVKDARLFLAQARRRNTSGYECIHRYAREKSLDEALGPVA